MSDPPKSFFLRVILPTLLVSGGTALGFWIQRGQIDAYQAEQLRQIQMQLDAEELAEKRARQDLHTPKGMPREVFERSAGGASSAKN
jgi:hypothetical protein